MGWDFCSAWKSKAEVIGAVKQSLCAGGDAGLIKYRSCRERGAHVFWAVVWPRGRDSELVCVLLDKQDGYWGYKIIGEAEGPAFWGCPRSFLSYAKPRNAAWRAQCELESDAERQAAFVRDCAAF